jgi:hypothetical protein
MENSWCCGTAVVILRADRTGRDYVGLLVKALAMTLRAVVCFMCALVAFLKIENSSSLNTPTVELPRVRSRLIVDYPVCGVRATFWSSLTKIRTRVGL